MKRNGATLSKFKADFYHSGSGGVPANARLSDNTIRAIVDKARQHKYGKNTPDALIRLAQDHPDEVFVEGLDEGKAGPEFRCALVRKAGVYTLLNHGGRVCACDGSRRNK